VQDGTNFSGKRVLLLLPEVFGRAGGIQMFNRALCLATGQWAGQNEVELCALVLNDSCTPDSRYVNGSFSLYEGAGKSKFIFIQNYLKQLIRLRPDLIIVGHVSLAPLTLLTSLPKRGTKTCIITYGVEVWRTLPLTERMALRGAEKILAISEHTKSELITRNRIDPKRVTLFPCSLDPFWTSDLSPQISKAGRPMILTVCRMMSEDAYKGVDSVIYGLPEIVRQCGPVDYRIVGEGSDVPRLKSLVKDLKLEPYVTFTGPLSDQELREHYRLCDLFIMPSEKEGFGIVFLEAMAYAKPVIGGAHGGTPSVVKDGVSGLLVNRSNIKQIEDAVIQLLKSHTRREELGQAGYQRLIENFTFDQFQANLNAALASCLSAS
jgi:phosphatidyl-myo-inositol dimannoside synthase